MTEAVLALTASGRAMSAAVYFSQNVQRKLEPFVPLSTLFVTVVVFVTDDCVRKKQFVAGLMTRLDAITMLCLEQNILWQNDLLLQKIER